MIDYALIGRRIKRSRKEKGITQEKMAEKLHVSVGYISQLERGITKINLETLAKISEITETEIAYFVSGINPIDSGYAADETSRLIASLDGEEREILLNQLRSYVELRNRKKSAQRK